MISALINNFITSDALVAFNPVKSIISFLPNASAVPYASYIRRIWSTVLSDNPGIILIRNGENIELPKTELNIGGKKIYKSKVHLFENDVFSDNRVMGSEK